MQLELTTNFGNLNATLSRTAGWTESFYDTGTTIDVFREEFELLCAKRAALLATGGRIVGQTYVGIDPPGPGATAATAFNGPAGRPADSPNVALVCRATAVGLRNTRTLKLAGIPDQFVTLGEFNPTPAYETQLQAFFGQLVDRHWDFRGKDFDQPAIPIFAISNAGLVTTMENTALVVGDFVEILRTQAAVPSELVRLYQVSAVTNATKFTLADWTAGAAKGGRVRKRAYVYPTYAAVKFRRLGTRKVGRPFTGFVGRQSKRT